jgi:hypothetical protein
VSYSIRHFPLLPDISPTAAYTPVRESRQPSAAKLPKRTSVPDLLDRESLRILSRKNRIKCPNTRYLTASTLTAGTSTHRCQIGP